MGSPFDINPLASTVAIDDRGSGETTFTVKNITTENVWGRATIVPDRDDRRAWFQVDRPERDFKAGEVEQVVVRLTVPADVPTGPSSFRLHVASIKRGDEDFTIGPAVGFEVAPIEPAVSKRPFPWWILLVAGGVLLVIVLAVLLWPRGGVPDVVGLTVAEATQAIEEGGLRLGSTTSAVSDKPAGTIIEQTPAAGAPAEAGEPVAIVIASQSPLVPSVIGKTVAEATAALVRDGFRAGRVIEQGEGTLGKVTGQNPRAGVPLAPNQDVDLTVPQPVVVPQVVGQTEVDARVILQRAALRVGAITHVGGGGPGRVLLQVPSAGETVAKGQAIALHVRGAT